MCRLSKIFVFLWIGFWSCVEIEAAHLIGGEFNYECLGGDQYQINLTLYRDCDQDPNCPNCATSFDPSIYIYYADESGNYINVNGSNNFSISFDEFSDESDVIPDFENVCADNIPTVCVKRGEYQGTITLPPRIGGYQLIFQRCCRNNTISNIIDPGDTGATYTMTISHETSDCDNSSPSFNNDPPIIICDDFTFEFDFSATDLDGDSLVYRLCTPNDGTAGSCPFISPFNQFPCPLVPTTFNPINWSAGYSETNQLGGTPVMNIDEETGLLTCTPDMLGQFVVGVCVDEYRDGVYLGTNLRDFQFNIADCEIVSAVPDADAILVAPGEFQLINCDEFLVNFDNMSQGANDFYWDFGDLTSTTDNSTDQFPSYIYPDTGKYTITLIAQPGASCTDTAELLLTLYPGFDTDFAFETEKCSDEDFAFQDLTTTTYGVIDSWEWDFGDGGSSTDQNPVHNFNGSGWFDVKLISTNDLGCRDSIIYPIRVWKEPLLDFDFTPFCLGDTVFFSGISNISDGGTALWSWDFGDVGTLDTSTSKFPYYIYDTTGDYTITLYSETTNGCTDEIQLDITIFPETVAEAGPSLEQCQYDSIQVFGSSIGGGGIDNTYHWEPAEFFSDPDISDPMVSLPESMYVYLAASDPNGCFHIDSAFVIVYEQSEVDAGEDVYVCLGENTQLMATSPDAVSISWSPNTTLNNSGILDPIATPTDTTDYIVSIIDGNNCPNHDTVSVNVVFPVIASAGDDAEICIGDTVELWATGGLSYMWTPADGLSAPDSSITLAYPSSTTTYTVEASNVDCFNDFADVEIVVNSLPFVDAGTGGTVNIGEGFELQGTGELTYSWSPSESLSDSTVSNPIATPLEPTMYYLTTTSIHGCEAVDSVFVDLTYNYEIIIPNAFSPNNDGVNDVIGLKTTGIESLIEFTIYNRWGQKLFTTSDLNEGWDGFFNGVEQELGVYVYLVRARQFVREDQFLLKGNITLVR